MRYKIQFSDFYLWASALLLCCATACSDDTFHTDNPDRPALTIAAQIEQAYVTRANDSGFGDGDQIGVFVVSRADGEPAALKLTGNHADNVRFTYSESTGKWTGSYALYWPGNGIHVDAYGYYPFNENLPSVDAYPFSVQANQRDPLKENSDMSGYEASDFLWAKVEDASSAHGSLLLKHTHRMAGIKVVLTEGAGFAEGEWAAAEKSVLIENLYLASTINMADGTPKVDKSGEPQTIIPQEAAGEYRAVAVPQTVEAGTNLIAVTIDGKAAHFAKGEAVTFLPSKLHRFTLTVNKGLETGDYLLELMDEAILPWENDPLSHDGQTREYITVHVEEGEYIGDVIERMGLNPEEILNLKLTGTFSDHDHFGYIRTHMPQLEAINMKELRTKNQESFYWEGGWGVPPYNQPIYADDYIPRGAFDNMAYLSYVVWPDHLVGIGNDAFPGCPLRGSLVFPEGLKHIGGSAFEAYGHRPSCITSIHIPSTMEYIGDKAFSGDNENYISGELVLPSRMVYLGDQAFYESPLLTGTIVIPDGLTVVNKSWGKNMTGDVRIPQGVKVVNGVSGSLTSIYLPEGVTEIGYGAFWNVSSLKGDLRLPSTIKKIGETAFSGTRFSHIQFPENLELIPSTVCTGCEYLQDTLTVPSSVKQIGERAFEGCIRLNAVIFPAGLEQIQGCAFRDCRSLDYIQCLGTTPPLLDGSAFDGVEKNNFTVVVPEEAVDAYRNAEGWKEFKRIAAYRNFVCRPMQAKLLNKSNTRTVVLNADGNWEVTHQPDWAHPSATSGFKKTELTVKIDAMGHGAGNRTDSIVFTLKDKTDEEGNPITAYYKISQFDSELDEDSQQLLQAATRGKGINLVFLGDGYDAEDIADGTFMADIKEGVEYFFAIEPYKTYKEYFNVYADVAMSYESGVCSNVNIWRETKFNTTYGAGSGGRLLVSGDDVLGYVLNDVEGSAVTAENVNQSLVVCVLNSDVYEGVTMLYSTGAAVAFVPHSRYDYPNDYRGLMQHEAGGHGFGKLGDEYVYHRDYIQTCPCVCCSHVDGLLNDFSLGWSRNLSLTGKYGEIEWRHLIFDPRYEDIVDIYEGGYFHARGVYRSELNSCMNNNVPYYSTISRQAIVERIKEYAGEKFDFEEFVGNDSREMGDKFLTRSYGTSFAPALHSAAPIVKPGSPLQYIKKSSKVVNR